MVKIKDLEELITDEKLDILYEIRNEDLNIMTKDERKKREEILGKNRISFDEVLAKVKNIPPHFKMTRENIEEIFDKYINQLYAEQSYDNERFYKAGFCDAICFILESKNKNI